jgi:hypothetical protein
MYAPRPQGWTALTNGALIRAAEEAGFDVMITADQGIRYQQNRTGYRLAFIVLSTNKETSILANLDSIQAALDEAVASSLVFVDLGE